MKRICLLFCFSFFVLHFAFGQGTWTIKSSFPDVLREGGVCFSIGSKGYVCGGNIGTYSEVSDFWEWDVFTGSWTQKADFAGGPRAWGEGFSIGTKGYVGMGCNVTNYYSDFWVWDQATNKWTQKANFANNESDGTSFSIDSFGYVWDGSDFWQYDPSTDVWTQKAGYPGQAYLRPASFVIGNKAYVGTGCSGISYPLGVTDFWEFDPLLNLWSQKANYPGTARSEANGFSIGNYGYIGGGTVGISYHEPLADFWRYNPSTDSWSAIQSFGGGKIEMERSFTIGCYGYIVMGFVDDPPYNQYLWQYYDSTNTTCANITSPIAGFESAKNTICANDCIDFTNRSTNAISWQWTFPGGSPSSSTDQNPQICYLTSGIYNVTIVAYNAGGSNTLSINNYITVNSAPPTPNVKDYPGIGNDTLVFTKDTSYISYQWYKDSTLINGASDTIIVVYQNGNYNVEVTGANGCKIGVGINVIIGLQNYMNDNFVSLSPNPTGDKFTVYGLQLTTTQVNIYNMLGQVCDKSEIVNRKSEIEIDVSALSQGIYFVQLICEKERWVGRFVKE